MNLVLKKLTKISNNNSIVKMFHISTKYMSTTASKNKIKSDLTEEIKISFYSKIQICKNGYVLRFLLPDSEKTLNLKVCQYVYLSAMLNNKIVSKPYHPISLDNDKGFIDIMIKVYQKEGEDLNYGIFSNYLSNLEVKIV